jgi:hypothetical protein
MSHVTNPKEEHGIPRPAPGTMTIINPPPHWPSGCGCADDLLFYKEHRLKQNQYVLNLILNKP